jgi:L-ascorbate metabolism protein UlaG (beta-lactamase superfamily)
MRLTKYTHACVRLEQDGSALVIDPGSFSEVEEALRGASAVLVTHEHPDHLDVERVAEGMAANQGLQLWAPAAAAAAISERLGAGAADRVHVSEPAAQFTAGGFTVRTFGGQHALIHPHVPMIANVGYLINDNVYHPGDSFIVPDATEVRTLLVPVHAPWSKTAEVIDFIASVRAAKAYPIHDSLLTDGGIGLVESLVARFGGSAGSRYEHLSPGQTAEV